MDLQQRLVHISILKANKTTLHYTDFNPTWKERIQDTPFINNQPKPRKILTQKD